MNQGLYSSHEPGQRWRFRRQAFTANGTWTRPAGVRDVRVEVCSGGGNGNQDAGCPINYYSGGLGAFAAAFVQNVPASVPITVGGGAGTSSFGSFVTCTGGSNASTGGNGANGAATLAGNAILESLVVPFFRAQVQVGLGPGSRGIGYGQSGFGAAGAGAGGVVIVEWMELYAP